MKACVIDITKGYGTLVDKEDFEALSQFRWYTTQGNGGLYAIRYKKDNTGRRKYLHNVIMRPPKGMMVDHVNRNGLDNRRSNLRLCTKNQNSFNAKMHSTNTSGYRGVCWAAREKKWRAGLSITVGGKRRGLFLGHFDNPLKASEAYQQKVKELFGEFARPI